jgi:hypothetical protein
VAFGSVYGLIVGMVVAVASLFIGVLNSSWSSDLLEERLLLLPNEGIRRSARNSLLSVSILGPVGGITSGLMSGLAFGLIGGLDGWLILSTGFTIAFGIVFGLIFGLTRGGIACIEHYLLRCLLWQEGVLPWNYVRFLDSAVERILLRKVGGGYIFYVDTF